MYTFQDFIKETDKPTALVNLINNHKSSEIYKVAVSADKYDRQQNETINNYVQVMFSMLGVPVEDFTASNNKLASNFFHRLNTQRCTYLLGNGVTFTEHKEMTRDEDGLYVTVDQTKETLGDKFDSDLKTAGYNALIHGVTFGFWNVDRLHVFPVTEFAPLWDEETGTLRAGARFWQISPDKPIMVVLYEEDGYTKYKSEDGSRSYKLQEIQPKKSYKTIIRTSQEGGDEVIGEENYGSLPIVPMWGSKMHQSTLVGMKQKIDSFDLIRSGFANDLSDCSQIYWILDNCGGMTEAELARFRDRLKIQHIASIDADNSGVTPYTQEIPFQARQAYLDSIRAGIYEDFGGLDVHTVAAGSTNDHIDAAYQPLDEEADDFEYQVIEFVQQILSLVGIEDTPTFKRNRISNQMEQVQMVALEANWLDEETILSKLPNVTVDEIYNILAKKVSEDTDRMDRAPAEESQGEGTQDEGAENEE